MQPVLREGRVVRDLVIEVEPAEPSVPVTCALDRPKRLVTLRRDGEDFVVLSIRKKSARFATPIRMR
jgi:hypothetical protein